MPTGPNGEKRPTDVIANAVHVMKVATKVVRRYWPEDADSAARASARSPSRHSSGSPSLITPQP